MNYSFHPHAEKELEEVENYYDSIRGTLGDRFRDDVQMTISRILTFPNGWQLLSKVIRRCSLTSFPYGIVYRVKSDEIRLFGGDASPSGTGLLDLSNLTTYLADEN